MSSYLKKYLVYSLNYLNITNNTYENLNIDTVEYKDIIEQCLTFSENKENIENYKNSIYTHMYPNLVNIFSKYLLKTLILSNRTNVIKQHYIPVFYIKKFKNNNKKISCINIKKMEKKDVDLESIFYDRGLYEDKLESMFSILENDFAALHNDYSSLERQGLLTFYFITHSIRLQHHKKFKKGKTGQLTVLKFLEEVDKLFYLIESKKFKIVKHDSFYVPLSEENTVHYYLKNSLAKSNYIVFSVSPYKSLIISDDSLEDKNIQNVINNHRDMIINKAFRNNSLLYGKLF